MSELVLKQRNYRQNIYHLPKRKSAEKSFGDFSGVPFLFLFILPTIPRSKFSMATKTVDLRNRRRKYLKPLLKTYQHLKRIYIFQIQCLFSQSNRHRHAGLLQGSLHDWWNAGRKNDHGDVAVLVVLVFHFWYRPKIIITWFIKHLWYTLMPSFHQSCTWTIEQKDAYLSTP